MPESLTSGLHLQRRGMDMRVRRAALNLMAEIVSGLGAADRTSQAVQTDALKFAIKAAKESSEASAAAVRISCANVMRSVYTPSWQGSQSGRLFQRPGLFNFKASIWQTLQSVQTIGEYPVRFKCHAAGLLQLQRDWRSGAVLHCTTRRSG